MNFKDLKKAIHKESLAWLFKFAKPFLGKIFVLLFIDAFVASIGIGSVVISKQMVDYTIAGKVSDAIKYIFIFVGIQVIILALGVLSSKISVRLSQKMKYSLERQTIEKLYGKEWLALNRYHSGDILSRLNYDTREVVSLWLSTIPGMVTLGFQLVLAFSVLFIYDKTLALLAFSLGPIAVVMTFLIGKRKKELQHKIEEAHSKYKSYITELIQHILIIKIFQYEEESLKYVSERQNERYTYAIKKNNMSIKTRLVMSGGSYLGYILAFVYGVTKIARGTSFGTFTAFLQLVGQVQSPTSGLASSFTHLISSLASVERLMELDLIENEIGKATSEPIIKRVGITMDRVCFGYNPEKKVLLDATFKAKPGEITALIGSSGEGKTTIMRLLLGLVKPDSGNITLDIPKSNDIPISSGTRSYFTYVPQGNTLFSGTIAENLRIGKPDASDKELYKVLKAACAWDFVQSLPKGLDTHLGESNTGISEGQAQRLCIARALLRTAPVLLLDEATSALDMETERSIFENIRKLENKTCVVITHRLSVLPLCDTVYRLEKGKLYKHQRNDFSYLIGKEKIS